MGPAGGSQGSWFSEPSVQTHQDSPPSQSTEWTSELLNDFSHWQGEGSWHHVHIPHRGNRKGKALPELAVFSFGQGPSCTPVTSFRIAPARTCHLATTGFQRICALPTEPGQGRAVRHREWEGGHRAGPTGPPCSEHWPHLEAGAPPRRIPGMSSHAELWETLISFALLLFQTFLSRGHCPSLQFTHSKSTKQQLSAPPQACTAITTASVSTFPPLLPLSVPPPSSYTCCQWQTALDLCSLYSGHCTRMGSCTVWPLVRGFLFSA